MKMIWWFLKSIFLSLLIIAGSALVIIGLINADNVNVTASLLQAIMSTARVIILLLSLITIVYLSYKVISAVINWSQSFVVKLVSLGVTALFFSETVATIVLIPLVSIKSIIQSLVNGSGENEYSGYAPDTKFLLSQALTGLLDNLQRQLIVVLNDFQVIVIDSPVVSILQLVTCWILFAFIINSLRQKGISNAGNFLGGLSKKSKKSLLFISLFSLSLFLSISAIVTLPWLEQEKSPEVINKAKLEQRLNEISLDKSTFDSKFPASLPKADSALLVIKDLVNKNSGDVLEQDLKLSSSAKKGYWISKKKNWDIQLSGINAFLKTVSDEIKNNDSNWLRSRNIALQTQSQLIKDFASRYDIGMLTAMSPQERSLSFGRFVSAQTFYVNGYSDYLNQYLSYRERIIKQLITDANSFKEDLSRERDLLKDSTNYSIPYLGREMIGHYQPYEPYLPMPSIDNFSFDNNDIGFSWGPFGWIAKWLIKAGSFALVLITGMLGFGLFGATIASYIRKFQNANFSNIAYEELIAVLIQGFSAAIVIFLAVQGGLAVFTSNLAKPNAYVLYFTCFIGAVFSEDVWTWAQKKMNENMAQGQPGQAATQPGQAATQPGQAATQPGQAIL
jgi:hypothetical protein